MHVNLAQCERNATTKHNSRLQQACNYLIWTKIEKSLRFAYTYILDGTPSTRELWNKFKIFNNKFKYPIIKILPPW